MSLTATPPRNCRRHPRGARSTVIWCAITVAVLHLGLAALAMRSTHLRDPLYSQRADALLHRIEETRTKEGQPTTIVMLGTSRTANGFNAARLEEMARRELGSPVVAQNYGILGSGPVIQSIYLRRMFEDKIRPDVLLLEVLPIYYCDILGEPFEKGNVQVGRVRRDEMKYLREYGIPTDPYENDWWRLWLNPWGEMRYQVLSHLRGSLLPKDIVWRANQGIDRWGWLAIPFDKMPPAEYRKRADHAKAEYSYILEHFVPSPHALKTLEDMLDLCKSHGTQVTLVLTPESNEFRGWYSKQTEERVKSVFTAVSQKHNCPLIDARDWIADDQFADSHHLLRRGATQFTERLASDYVVPRLRSERVSEKPSR